jgi:uncharacterized protein YoxC
MQFDIALRIVPIIVLREYSHASGLTQSEMARTLDGLTSRVHHIGSETRMLLALIAELQNVTRNSTSTVSNVVAAVAQQAGRVADAVSSVQSA